MRNERPKTRGSSTLILTAVGLNKPVPANSGRDWIDTCTRLWSAIALSIGILGTAAPVSFAFDLTGSWQVTSDCGTVLNAQVLAVSRLAVTHNTTTGAVVWTTTDCGTLALDGEVHPLTATCNQQLTPGYVSGSSVSMPGSGFQQTEFAFVNPFPSASAGCVTPPLDRFEFEQRFAGTVQTDGMGQAIRIAGSFEVGQAYGFDTSESVCYTFDFGGSAPCSFVMLRNVAEPGSSVTVEPLQGATVTFDEITAGGFVNVTPLTEPSGQVPAEFQLFDVAVYFDVTTSASFTPPIVVCLPYLDEDNDGIVDGTTPGVDETTLQILHEEGGTFVDRTTSRDAAQNQICATVSSLSQFVVVGNDPTTTCGNTTIDGGEDCDDGNTLNGDCCSSVCTFETLGYSCTGDGNPCTADTCDGNGICNHDPGNAGEVCRSAADTCDATEVCDGLSSTCPADTFAPLGTSCAEDGIACTSDECDGLGTCVHPPGNMGLVCRPAEDDCDVAEACDGISSACPIDALQPDGTLCDDSDPNTAVDFCSTGICYGGGAVESFKCYKIKDIGNPRFTSLEVSNGDGVTLGDQFTTEEVDVIKPFLLCNPTAVNDRPIGNTGGHLTCFKIKGDKLPQQTQVEVSNSLGATRLRIGKPFVLCAPSSKSILP